MSPEQIIVLVLGLALIGLLCGLVWALLDRNTLKALLAQSDDRLAAERRLSEQSATEIGELSSRVRLKETEVHQLETAQARHAEQAKGRIAQLEQKLELERARHAERETELRTQQEHAEQRLKQMLADAEQRAERYRADAEARAEKQIAEIKRESREAFGALAGQTLKDAQDGFMKLAREAFERRQQESTAELEKRRAAVEQMVKPIGETLQLTQERLLKLDERVRQTTESNEHLRTETAKLARALSRPEVRGRYGEIQLRRVAELAGMTDYCDFCEQHSTVDSDGHRLRPDMLVQMPSDRVIAVDAKTNINSYLEAVNAESPEEQERHLEKFAKDVFDQAKALSDKKYWSRYQGSPEFVVMFVPGDHFIDAALQRKPQLIDFAAERGVILASPSTLIGLLRAVFVGWREARLAEEARALFALGQELHDRAAVVFGHADKLGRTLDGSVRNFNKLVGSIDARLLPTLRRFEEIGVKTSKQLESAGKIEQTPRGLEGLDDAAADASGGGDTTDGSDAEDAAGGQADDAQPALPLGGEGPEGDQGAGGRSASAVETKPGGGGGKPVPASGSASGSGQGSKKQGGSAASLADRAGRR